MIGFLIYLVGCVLAAMWCYREIIKEQDSLTIKDLLAIIFITLFSWLSDIIIFFHSFELEEILEKLDNLLDKEVIKFNKKDKEV